MLFAVATIASDSGSAQEIADPTPYTCDFRTVHRHVHAGKADVDRAFEPQADRHLRQTKAWQPHKFCLVRKHDRSRLAEYVDERQRELRQAERRRRSARSLTPYDCGSAGHFAIPCYIVACESHYSWSASNPSGAVGPYQLLGWGAPFPVTSRADKQAHHRIAARLWAGGAGASHWVCA